MNPQPDVINQQPDVLSRVDARLPYHHRGYGEEIVKRPALYPAGVTEIPVRLTDPTNLPGITLRELFTFPSIPQRVAIVAPNRVLKPRGASIVMFKCLRDVIVWHQKLAIGYCLAGEGYALTAKDATSAFSLEVLLDTGATAAAAISSTQVTFPAGVYAPLSVTDSPLLQPGQLNYAMSGVHVTDMIPPFHLHVSFDVYGKVPTQPEVLLVSGIIPFGPGTAPTQVTWPNWGGPIFLRMRVGLIPIVLASPAYVQMSPSVLAAGDANDLLIYTDGADIIATSEVG